MSETDLNRNACNGLQMVRGNGDIAEFLSRTRRGRLRLGGEYEQTVAIHRLSGVDNEMNPISFTAWANRQDRRRRDHVPDAYRLTPMIATAGRMGLSRTRIGHAVSIEPAILDDLLAALVSMGQLQVYEVGGVTFYRAN